MKRKSMVPKGTTKRLLKMLFSFYPFALPLVILCVIFTAAISSIPSIFMQNIIAVLEQNQGAAGRAWGRRSFDLSRSSRGCTSSRSHRRSPSRADGRHYAGLAQEDARALFHRMEDLPVRY